MEFSLMTLLNVLMLAIMFLAVLVEIKTGGFGAGVLLGLIAAAMFLGSNYVHVIVYITHIDLFLGGILLIIIEVLSPMVGILAALGIAMIFYSVILALGADLNALYALAIALLLAVIIFIIIINRLPSNRLWHKLMLKNASTKEEGFVSAPQEDDIVGKEGIVLTELRPAGSVQIENRRFDVVSEGDFIEKGAKVIVVSVNGRRIVVKRLLGSF